MSLFAIAGFNGRGFVRDRISSWTLLVLGLTTAGLLAFGCLKREVSRKTGTSNRGDSTVPSLDVRGGIADSDVYLGLRTIIEGVPGNGGEIRLTTSGGDIAISDGALAEVAQVESFVGDGFDVAPGQNVSVAGARVVNWLRVQAGGTLTLTEDTFFVVLGDVLIAGRVDGRGNKHLIDGRDLTIDADGIVNITGVIDTGGFVFELDKSSAVERGEAPGGHGGEVYISSAETTGDSPGPHIFLSGEVRSKGGDSTSQEAAFARPGRGGQILIGSAGVFAMSGKISARGGRCYFNTAGGEGHGGEIHLVALGDLTIANVREISAAGGDGSGGVAGTGGTILLEAPVGALNLSRFDIECRGGRTTFDTSGIGGQGGTLTFSAANINLATMTIDMDGGDAVEAGRGEGGQGGVATMAGSTSITVNPDVFISAQGGQTLVTGVTGGTGGNVQLANYDDSDPTALSFLGAASVRGGKDTLNSTGSDGKVCSVNSNTASDLKLVGTNNFPNYNCTTSDLEAVVVHDLDCDEATIRPDSVETELPVVSGSDFYRLVVTQAMIDDGVTTVTVTITGEESGNIDLYAGTSAVLGSTNVGLYTWSSTEATSEESVDVPIGGLTAGEFRSILVVEQFNFVEEYTIAVACSS